MRELSAPDDRELHRVETSIAVIQARPHDHSRTSLLAALKTKRSELLKIRCGCRAPTRSAYFSFVNRMAS